MNLFRRLVREAHRRSLWQVLGIYAFGSWAAYQVILDLTDGFGLPGWVPPFAAVLFLIGLPIVLATAFIQEGGPGTASSSAEERREPTRPALRRALTWRRSLVAGVAAFALLGAGATGYMTMRVAGVGPVGTLVAKGVLEDRDPIVLADFTATGADSLLGRVVTEALRIDLIESEVVRLAQPRQVTSALELMGRDPRAGLPPALARELAQREGLKAVLAGEVGGLGGSYVLAAQLVASDDGRVLAAFREAARDSTGLIDAVDRLSKRIRERVGESLRTIHRAEPLSQVATASLPALRRYSEAVRLLDETGEALRATQLLEEAVALDTTFGMAWRKLGVQLGNTGIRDTRAREALQRAYALRDRQPEKERYHAEASYHMRVSGRDDAAIEAYRKILALDPHDHVALNNLPILLMERRQWTEAESILRTAVAAPEAGWFPYLNLAETQWAQRRFEEARATLDAARARFPRNTEPHRQQITLLAAEGQYAEADSLARVALGEHSSGSATRPPLLFTLTDLARLRGRAMQAEGYTREIGRFAREAQLAAEAARSMLGPARLSLDVRRDPALALRDLRSALAGLELGGIPPLDRPYLQVAEIFARAGRPDSAEAWLTVWNREARPHLAPDDAGPRAELEWIRGWIAFHRGDPEPLLALLRRRIDEGSCTTCWLADLADVHDRLGRPDSAIANYERFLETSYLFRLRGDAIWRPYALERLAQLHDARGDDERAVEYYARFLELWTEADPDLQPRVEAARRRLAALVGRGG